MFFRTWPINSDSDRFARGVATRLDHAAAEWSHPRGPECRTCCGDVVNQLDHDGLDSLAGSSSYIVTTGPDEPRRCRHGHGNRAQIEQTRVAPGPALIDLRPRSGARPVHRRQLVVSPSAAQLGQDLHCPRPAATPWAVRGATAGETTGGIERSSPICVAREVPRVRAVGAGMAREPTAPAPTAPGEIAENQAASTNGISTAETVGARDCGSNRCVDHLRRRFAPPQPAGKSGLPVGDSQAERKSDRLCRSSKHQSTEPASRLEHHHPHTKPARSPAGTTRIKGQTTAARRRSHKRPNSRANCSVDRQRIVGAMRGERDPARPVRAAARATCARRALDDARSASRDQGQFALSARVATVAISSTRNYRA